MCETKPCINPNCVDGWDTGRPAPVAFSRGRDSYLRSCERLRCCTACGGRGFLADERENRRHYYDMRALVAELENDGRFRDWDADPLIGLPVESDCLLESTALESALTDIFEGGIV